VQSVIDEARSRHILLPTRRAIDLRHLARLRHLGRPRGGGPLLRPAGTAAAVSGWTRFRSQQRKSSAVVACVMWPSKASRVWISTSSPGAASDDRRDRLVPAIVTFARLLGEALAIVDRDAFHDTAPRPHI
jgi:hypothetical protein